MSSRYLTNAIILSFIELLTSTGYFLRAFLEVAYPYSRVVRVRVWGLYDK